MKQYLDMLTHLKEKAVDKDDRTGTGTFAVFGYQNRFNLQDGFPLMTTKKMFPKSIFAELLWFLEGSTDERRLAELTFGKDRTELVEKNTVWTENADAQGKDLGYENNDTIKVLGPVYGYGWRKLISDNSLELIENKIQKFEEFERTEIILEDIVLNEKDEFVGKIVKNNKLDEFLVLEKISTPKNSSYKLQCVKTGCIKVVTRPNLKSGTFGIYLRFNRFYIGGKYNNKNLSYYDKGQTLWYNMTSRCYDESHPSYKFYKDVVIHPKWNNLDNFLEDIVDLPFFYEWIKTIDSKRNNWELDKDYLATNLYSKETCIFVDSKKNKSYGISNIDFSFKRRVIFENGTYFDFIFMSDLLDKYPQYNFCKESIRLCLLGSQKTHRKCIFMKIPGINTLFRKKLYTDQISELIEEIKRNPNSRRLIVSAWDPTSLKEAALPPCHTMFQFQVADGKLSCQLYQRSADSFLGVPYNIASYALLTHMIAHVTDLEVGDFIHTFGDLHIYKNHLTQVDEQLSREAYPLPTLKFARKVESIFDFKLEDFVIENYKSHPPIKAKMAV